MTWIELAQRAGVPVGAEEYALWNLTAFPFVGVREVWYQLRHSLRLAARAGYWPDSPDGGFR